jgi:hypothetical protein
MNIISTNELIYQIKELLEELEREVDLIKSKNISQELIIKDLQEELKERKKSKTGWDLFFKIFGKNE